jgi:hypothetical protein
MDEAYWVPVATILIVALILGGVYATRARLLLAQRRC